MSALTFIGLVFLVGLSWFVYRLWSNWRELIGPDPTLDIRPPRYIYRGQDDELRKRSEKRRQDAAEKRNEASKLESGDLAAHRWVTGKVLRKTP